MKTTIEILIIGNEILSGRTADSNGPYMRDRLVMAGYDVDFISVIGDTRESIVGAAQIAAGRADIVLVSGGLGPTSDDMTAESIAVAFGLKLRLDDKVLDTIRDRFIKFGRVMSESNTSQAMVPVGATVIHNPVGTAPGIRLHVSESDATFYLMPGVPKEIRAIFDETVLPEIVKSYQTAKFEFATVSVNGVPESELYDRIKHLPGAEQALAYYPKFSGIEIRIRTGENAPATAEELKHAIVKEFGDCVFSTSAETLEQAVGNILSARGLTVAIAESCTGGLISNRLTNVSGSSAYMLYGAVTYSNESKSSALGVDMELIQKHGAVSEPVAREMAEGVRKMSGADIGISTTGIAGPTGGSADKPIGLMFTGISDIFGTDTKKLQFVEDRLINKSRMSQAVLDMLRHRLIAKHGG